MTENDIAKFEVKKILFGFTMDQLWLEIKSLTKFSWLEYHCTKYGSDTQSCKHDAIENLCIQISGISRQQAPMLVSIGAQHLHLHQVLLPILPLISFAAVSFLLARSLTEFLP